MNMLRQWQLAAVSAAVSLVVGTASAADFAVNDWTTAKVDGSQSVGNGVVAAGAFAYGIEKSGDGSWTLPLQRLLTQNPLNVFVRQGCLTLENDGTHPSVAQPPAAMSRALLWVAADQNVETAGGAVSAWYDVRETKPGDAWGTAYPAAVAVTPSWALGTTSPSLQQVDGRSMVWFGGAPTAGVTMGFRSAADRTAALTLSSIREVFIVTRVVGCFGNVIGVKSGSKQYFQSASASNLSGEYLAVSAGLVVPSGVNRRNGVLFDPVATKVQTGTQLLNYHHPFRADVTADYFFNDREMQNRAGGDYLCEALFFTSELSVLERASIEAYLMSKWGIPVRNAQAEVTVARGAEVDVGALGVRPSGDGALTVRNAPAGTRLDDVPDATFSGSVRVVSGSLTVGAAGLSAATVSGTAMTAVKGSEGDYAVTASNDSETGKVKVAVEDAGGLGGTCVRLGDIPASVEEVVVAAETVSLAASTQAAPPASVEAVFTNPGFEGLSTYLDVTKAGEAVGWKFSNFSNASAMFRAVVFWGVDHLPPEGQWAMGLKLNANGSTVNASSKVTVPVRGAYELSFMTCSRNAGASGMVLSRLSLAKDGTVMPLGAVICYPLTGYTPRRYRTPVLEPGEYELTIAATARADSLAWFDDFKMRLAPDQDTAEVFAVPNGSFEVVNFPYHALMNTMHKANTAEGWTFASANRGVRNDGCPSVSIGTIGMSADWYNGGSSRYGNTQLVFWDGDGSATSAAFTTLPAGTWRLRCRACRWGSSDWWPGSGTLLTAKVAPEFTAVAVVNGTEHALGAVTADDRLFAAKAFPTTLTVADGDSVSLVLRQTKTDAAGHLDDLEFVRVADDDLVTDGGFEGADTWTLANNRPASGPVSTTSGAGLWSYASIPESFGYKPCAGAKALRLVDLGSAEQSVTFPAGGTYRLSFWARPRVVENANPRWPNMYRHAGNRVRATLVDGSAQETEILVTDALYATNFVKCSALFRVDGPGVRTLRLAGVHDGTVPKPFQPAWNNDLNVLIDEVSVTKAASTAVSLNPAAALKFRACSVLNLDFEGTNQVELVEIGGRRVSGLINAERFPGLITGLGALYVKPKGFTIFVR